MREIRSEHEVTEQLAKIGISYRRFDEVMDYVQDILCSHPEAFPVIHGTRISICLTNEFVGNSFPDIPALSIYFHYDAQTVKILSVEECDIESYGTSFD
jgi:hypothetical protein